MSLRGCLRGLPLLLGASAAAEAAASLLSALAAAEPFFGAGFFAGALGRAVGSEIARPSAEANGFTALGLGEGELATVRRLCSARAAMVPRGTLFPKRAALLYAGRGGGRVFVWVDETDA
ncbi:hypothetical protein B0H14DRAFT_3048035, partial [Mycena olivaceomarginata]